MITPDSAYLEVLRNEFQGEEGSFFYHLRGGDRFRWDTEAFSRLISAMGECVIAFSDAEELPRWLAEGFWYSGWFIKQWSSHPSFPRTQDWDYYEAAYTKLDSLAFGFFLGKASS